MADNPETVQWETGVYQLETTDQVMGGAGGVSNRPNVELGNRTAYLKDVLDNNAIFDPGDGGFEYGGQNVDVKATFGGSVANGDAVYWSGSQYDLCLAGNGCAGFADVSGGRVITSGLFAHTNMTGAAKGSALYVSGSVAGSISTTPTIEPVGVCLYISSGTTGVMLVNVAGKGQAHSLLYDDETSKHFLVGDILHSAINNDQMNIHMSLDDLIGQFTFYVSNTSVPTNYLHCNGALISKTTYADLYSGYPFSIGNRFGESGGSFYLPDFRGRVPRGWANGSSRDPDRGSRYADVAGGITGDYPGSMQNDAFESHYHAANGSRFVTTSGSEVGDDDAGNKFGRETNTQNTGGNETRMHNFSAMWVIRYQ